MTDFDVIIEHEGIEKNIQMMIYNLSLFSFFKYYKLLTIKINWNLTKN